MCKQCEAIVINGVLCHETGCPEAYKDQVRECKWCGQEFTPEEQRQEFCSEDCYRDYYNLPAD
jgi:hypothetical protein